jgi:hypothetical protein
VQAVPQQAGLRVDEDLFHPLGHRARPLPVGLLAAGLGPAGEQDRGRTVGRDVLEVAAAPPPDPATRVVGPLVAQLAGDAGQRLGHRDPLALVRAQQREAEPGDVVVEFVGPLAEVAQPHAAHHAADHRRAARVRLAQLCVHEAVEQVRLPPVVPVPVQALAVAGRPAGHAEPGAGQRPQPPQVPGEHRAFGDRGARGPEPRRVLRGTLGVLGFLTHLHIVPA